MKKITNSHKRLNTQTFIRYVITKQDIAVRCYLFFRHSSINFNLTSSHRHKGVLQRGSRSDSLIINRQGGNYKKEKKL